MVERAQRSHKGLIEREVWGMALQVLRCVGTTGIVIVQVDRCVR